MVLYVVQTNPLKRIAVGPDYKYPLRQSIHLFMFYTLHCVYSYSSLATVNVADSQIPLADHIKILGVTFDKNLSMNNHVKSVCKSVHYHIRALRHIHSSISEDMAKMVACDLVGSRLDYANSVLFGATQNKKLSYRRGTARCVVSIEILPITIRYDTKCYFNVRSKADISRLNLPHGNDN